MSSSSAATIIGIGSATPPGVSTQSQSTRFAIDTAGLTGDAARFADAVYARSGIARRSSALLDSVKHAGDTLHQSFYGPATGPTDRGPSTAARMHAYAALAPSLAAAAAERAIAGALPYLGPKAAEAITHLVVVSCTGFSAPGLDVLLIDKLGLPSTVQRLTIGFMGCHGGLVGLRTARALALAASTETPANVLLVCVELCSLHFQYGSRQDQIVANALFADGAAAVVVSNRTPDVQESSKHNPLVIQSSASTLIPASEDAMSWNIGDHGFEMTLRESVPEVIRTQLGPWTQSWLKSCGVDNSAASQCLWAIHPGGPRVLNAVGDALGLDENDLACSRAILHDYGNMSSPTVLFAVQRLLASSGREQAVKPIVVVGFGPGITAEAVLLVPSCVLAKRRSQTLH